MVLVIMSVHNFHLSESSFTCPRLWASGLVRKLVEMFSIEVNMIMCWMSH